MDDCQIIPIDLNDRPLRAKYSASLQAMEEVFTYPLGQSQFMIRHGFGHDRYDYFSYFEQLGQPHFYVLELDSKVIGSVCCVLREIEGQKVWYICDLKVIPSAQFRKIPTLIYQLLHQELLSITDAFYFVNMSPEKHNGLYKVAQRLMANFSLKIQPYYIYELTHENLKENAIIAHNHGKKDIVINDQTLDLYHVVNDVRDRCNQVQLLRKDQLSNDSIIMLGSVELLDDHQPSSEGIFVSCNFTMPNDLSTFEI